MFSAPLCYGLYGGIQMLLLLLLLLLMFHVQSSIELLYAINHSFIHIHVMLKCQNPNSQKIFLSLAP